MTAIGSGTTPVTKLWKGFGVEEQSKVVIIAEIKKTQQRKTTSLDNVYQVVLETDNPQLLELGTLPPDATVKVTFEVNHG